jgi:hypothetical protein
MRECLGIWLHFVDFIVQEHKQHNSNVAERFKSGLLAFVNQLTVKMQYIHNPSELSDVEDDIENENGQTDYDVFVDELLEIYIRLVELYAGDLVPFLFQQLDNLESTYSQMARSQRNGMSF